MPSEDTEEPKDDDSAGQDTEANRDTSNSDSNGVLTIDVECLCRPEEQNGEEIGSRDKGDDECQDENPRILL